MSDQPKDTGKAALRVIIGVVMVLLALEDIAVAHGAWYILVDAAVIVIAVGLALGKRKVAGWASVASLLLAAASTSLWVSDKSAFYATTAIVWGLLFVGCLYVNSAPKPS